MNVSPIEYREATVEDWNELTAFRNIYSEEGLPKARMDFEQDFIGGDLKNKSILFVAIKNDDIVGYGRCSFFDPQLGKTIYGQLESVPMGYYTTGVLSDQSVRGLGVGKKLTDLRAQWTKQFEDKLYSILQSHNEVSINMHKTVGFELVKDNLIYPGDMNGDCTGQLYCMDL